METVPSPAEKIEGKTQYAGVGLAHADNYELPLTSKDPYAVNFQGLQIIESNA